MPVIGLLLPPSSRPPPPPETLPIGRAALSLADTLTVVVGATVQNGRLDGHRAVPGSWEPIHVRLDAAIDRFPSFTRPAAYAALLRALGPTPIFNPPRLTALLRDKVRTQHALSGLPMPVLETDPRRFGAFTEGARRAAFHKPRFGSFGRGVSRVVEAAEARAVVDSVDQPMLMQRAVDPPPGFAGVALRILVQHSPQGPIAHPPVARHHASDPVVNRARGAAVSPASDVFGAAVAQNAQALALRVLERFPGAIELGVDVVLDPRLTPFIIEVNARPRGRLAALATTDPARFGPAHLTACRTPFLAAAGRLQRT